MRVFGNETTPGGDTLRQVSVAASIAATVVINALANIVKYNGRTTAEISDSFPVYFVPAGYVFSIWGIIYLGLLAFGVYQALPAQRDNPALRKIGYLVVGTGIANSAWIFLWHYGFYPLTLVVMLALLVMLIAVYLRLDIGRARMSAAERWAVQIPFSIYLAWITVATIANATDLLYNLGWDGWGISGAVWAALLLVVATLIAAFIGITRGDTAFLLVIVWAFAGIAVKQSDEPLVATTAGVMAGVVALVILWSLFGNRLARPRLRAGAV